jgi:uncharacterized protein
MSDDGSKLRDVSILADEGTAVVVEIPVTRMTRLLRELSAPTGIARGTVSFARERGFAVADVQVTADVSLVCQRCLKPMVMYIEAGSRVFLPHSEAAAERVPDDAELMIAPDGRLKMSELIEEDLLLALPFAPLHPEDARCGQRDEPAPSPDGTDDENVQRPFAALGDLMGRTTRDEPKRQTKRRGRGD